MAGGPPTYNPPMSSEDSAFEPELAKGPEGGRAERVARLRRARGFRPEGPLRGELVPPPSKSIAQRWILAAALAEGTSVIQNLAVHPPVGADVARALGLAERCAREFSWIGETACRIEGAAPTEHDGPAPTRPLEVGESGTLARFATAALALGGSPTQPITIVPAGTLLLRRSQPLFDALEGAGVSLVRQNLPGTWPVALVPTRKPGLLQLDRAVSSQEVSGLLLGLAAHPDSGRLKVTGPLPSAPYIALTLRTLADFGVETRVDRAPDGAFLYEVRGPLRAPSAPLVVEADASAAGVGLAAAVITGGDVRVALRSDTAQGDADVVEHLRAFGCRASHDEGYLHAGGFPECGAELDLEGCPDLAPPLAAVAAAVALRQGEETRLAGLGTLGGKESDRLEGLCEGLSLAGFRAARDGDSLRVAPGPHGVEAVALDPRSDHRMAFAFALLSLLRPNVRVLDPECVTKSWPGFWEDLSGLGAVEAAP